MNIKFQRHPLRPVVRINDATCKVEPTFDHSIATAEDIHFAISIHLPFRLRIRGRYRCSFGHHGYQFDLWTENQVDLPGEGEHFNPEKLIPEGNQISDLWTNVVLILLNPVIEQEELTALHNCNGNFSKFLLPGSRFSPIMHLALNSFIMAYGDVSGGLLRGNDLRMLNAKEFFESVYSEVTLVGIPSESWNRDNITSLFEEHGWGGKGIAQIPQDLPLESLSGISECIERQSNFLFYELAFEAETRWFAHDRVSSLLMAVAALEGVHGAFVTHTLQSRLPSNIDTSKLSEDFIRGLGMSLCNELSPYLLMPDDVRPPAEVISKASLGLKYRNEIMHALRNKKGYRIKTRTAREIEEGFLAVMELYYYYRTAFESIPIPPKQMTTRSRVRKSGKRPDPPIVTD